MQSRTAVLSALFWASLLGCTALAWLPASWLQVSSVASSDKAMHLAAWCYLATLALLLRPGGCRPILILPLLFCWSMALEAVQYLLPHRSFEWTDIAANMAGILLGLAIWSLAVPLSQKLKPALLRR